MKKILAVLLALFSASVLFTVALADTFSIAKKTANELRTEYYNIEIQVPGDDPTNKHDEVILMVDGSYSMDNEWPDMKKAITEIGKAFLNGTGNTQLTLMAFGMADNEVLTHIKSVSELETALGKLPGTLLYGRSSTNCEAGFAGVSRYIDNHDNSLNDVHVVFISDGNINTDETPYRFYNWKENTWLKWKPEQIAQNTLSYECEHILAGGERSEAFKAVFGAKANPQEVMQATAEDAMKWADKVWEDVYAYSGMDKNKAYPVSRAETAFVRYDKEHDTYVQDAFYYALVGRKYPDQWTRTPAAANELAAKKEVKSLYLVDYDSYSSWMDTGVTNAQFVQSNGISGLVDALKGVITNLSKTPFSDVVVTDYMSKWVELDRTTLKIVDNTTGATIWTSKDGWKTSNRPTSKEVPVVVTEVPASEYQQGGNDVLGNSNGTIYKLTWFVKDGALMKNHNFSLIYTVNVDALEKGFHYNKLYPANGNTNVEYDEIDGDTIKHIKEDIKVPDVIAKIKIEVIHNLPKTGDDNKLYIYVIMFLGAVSGLIIINKERKR